MPVAGVATAVLAAGLADCCCSPAAAGNVVATVLCRWHAEPFVRPTVDFVAEAP